ncbi:MAG: cupin domain-containing protein [Actinobacteria bacterium]|nr:MAG: cupin domain-containing protein [Actinomycetota bacterium]
MRRGCKSGWRTCRISLSGVLAHWNEVAWERIDRGPLQGSRQRLGAAAGTAHAGLSRYRMASGERAMPVHVHADEEELFYVLDGSGLSWQDARTYTIAAGDCIVHLRNAEAHTIVAGGSGLDVLAFGSGSDARMVWLPRANAWWMGPRWLPSDGPNPLRLEAAAGELELPEPEPSRPPTIVATRVLAPESLRQGDVDSEWRDLGVAAGSALSGICHVTIAPGARSCPFHCHGAEEEIFVILSGAGTLRLGDERHAVETGHVVARPPGTRIAHQFIAGDDGLTLLAWGTRDPNDIVWYPDSKKVSLRGIGIRARVEPLDYWDGEG